MDNDITYTFDRLGDLMAQILATIGVARNGDIDDVAEAQAHLPGLITQVDGLRELMATQMRLANLDRKIWMVDSSIEAALHAARYNSAAGVQKALGYLLGMI